MIRLTAAQIAVELSREAGGTRGRRRGFWDRLLARAYEDPLEARDDAQARGIALAPGYVAVAVEGEGLDEAGAVQKNAEIRRVCLDTLGTRTGDVVVIERGGGFFFLVPAPLEVDAANARTAATLIPRGIARAGLDVRVVGGVGRHAEMIAVAQSVDESREAMTIARRMFGGGRVMPYDDLGVYPLLHRTGATREDWRTFATRVLEPLRQYDEKHQTELVRTLQLFFDVGQNIKEAAAQLNVHRHTVFYRLRQIGEIGRLDLDSPARPAHRARRPRRRRAGRLTVALSTVKDAAATRRAALASAKEHGVRWVRLSFVDVLGIEKSVTVPVGELERALDGNVTFDGGSIDGVVSGEELDMVLRPDPATFTVLPWTVGGQVEARVLCDIATPDGTPFEGCPRTTLKRVLEDAGDVLQRLRTGWRSSSTSSRSTRAACPPPAPRTAGRTSTSRPATAATRRAWRRARRSKRWASRSRARTTSTAPASTSSTSPRARCSPPPTGSSPCAAWSSTSPSSTACTPTFMPKPLEESGRQRAARLLRARRRSTRRCACTPSPGCSSTPAASPRSVIPR